MRGFAVAFGALVVGCSAAAGSDTVDAGRSHDGQAEYIDGGAWVNPQPSDGGREAAVDAGPVRPALWQTCSLERDRVGGYLLIPCAQTVLSTPSSAPKDVESFCEDSAPWLPTMVQKCVFLCDTATVNGPVGVSRSQCESNGGQCQAPGPGKLAICIPK